MQTDCGPRDLEYNFLHLNGGKYIKTKIVGETYFN